MRILLLMVSPGDARGGMEKHFIELANGLAAKGHQLTCVSAKEHLSGLDASISRHPINPQASRYSPSLYYYLFKLFRAQSFDIGHAQGSKAADILKRFSPLFRQTKFIATIHNFKSRYPGPRAFCRLIAVSKALAADIGYKNVTVVYNGLRIPATSADASTSDTAASDKELLKNLARPIWLSVGRLVPAKGYDNLIEAFQHVNGSLIIAGSGPEAERLNRQVIEEGLSLRVRLVGHKNEIWPLMKSADAVVISSRREGFSYVFAEALMAGKPIISTDVPIANEFLPNSSIIPQDISPEEFAGFLNRDPDEIYQEQASARQRSKNELTLDAMIENTLLGYRDCLSS